MCFNDKQLELVRKVSGGNRLTAPIEYKWKEVSPEEYEESARSLACGLMVKGLHRGDTVNVSNASDDSFAFISFACRLAHLTPSCKEGDSEFAIDALSDDACYLMNIGAAWMGKYKPILDRSIRSLSIE